MLQALNKAGAPYDPAASLRNLGWQKLKSEQKAHWE